MKRILFVDDDLNVLHGLKRMLRPMRHEWEMEFKSSGHDALNTMSESHFDVIVSDMRMPHMDGCELLQNVMKQYPDCIRIILSGHSDNEMILRSVQCAHQYLIKPCDAKVLRSTINRACNLQNIIDNDKLRTIISGMKELPSLPDSYHLIIEEMQKPEPSLKKVGEIVAHDVSMSAKILQLVNSAFFGLPQKIANPQQAAIYLGVETLKALVLSTHVFSAFTETSALLGFSLPDLFNHSMAVGNLAKKVLDHAIVDKRKKDEVLISGLLHDIGKLLLLNIPDQYKQIRELHERTGCGELAAEYEVLQTSHAEMGAYLLGLWGLPAGIVETVAFHHNPSGLIGHIFYISGKTSEENGGNEKPNGSSGLTSVSDSMNGEEYHTLTAVHVANALINQEDCASDTTDFKYIDNRYLRALNLADKLPEWVECCEEVRQREG